MLRGLKAGPKETTFIYSITQIVISTLAIIVCVATLFFDAEKPDEHETILSWSILIVFLGILPCALRMASTILASTFGKQKQQPRLKHLQFLSGIMLIVSGIFGFELLILEPGSVSLVFLVLLLPVFKLCHMLACWIRHEADLAVQDEWPNQTDSILQKQFVTQLTIAVPIFLFAGTWGYWLFLHTIPQIFVSFLFPNCLYLALFMLGVLLFLDGKANPKHLDKVFAWSTLTLLTFLMAEFIFRFIQVESFAQPSLIESAHKAIFLGFLGLVFAGFSKNTPWIKWAALGYAGVVLLQNTLLLTQAHPWMAEYHSDWIGLKLAFLPKITYSFSENRMQHVQGLGTESVQAVTSCTYCWFYYWFGALALLYVFGMRNQKKQETRVNDAASLAYRDGEAKQNA